MKSSSNSIDQCKEELSYQVIQNWYLVENRCNFRSGRKITTEVDCLILDGISFRI